MSLSLRINRAASKIKRNYGRRKANTAKKKAKKVVSKKWLQDSKSHSVLKPDHEEIYKNIFLHHYLKTGRFPNIIYPKCYNDKIAWLMLFDQHPKLPVYMDKLAVRNYVENLIGKKYLTEILWSGKHFLEMPVNSLPSRFCIKTNHDSGTVFLIRDKTNWNAEEVELKIEKSLSKAYGTEKGEWAYKFIARRIFIEELLDAGTENSPADYKFHCVNGKVKWMQYIFDRGRQTKEACFDRDFNLLPLHLDHDFVMTAPKKSKPENWAQIVCIAEKLAADFKYVRVDLYNIGERIVFGELTFFPKAGCYTTPDNEKFGSLLNFDIETVRQPIYKNNLCSIIENA